MEVSEPVEHQLAKAPSPERSYFDSLNDLSHSSITSRNLTDNRFNPPNFPEIAQELAVAPQSSEAMPTVNQGSFGPFQPQSSQSELYDQPHDSTHEIFPI